MLKQQKCKVYNKTTMRVTNKFHLRIWNALTPKRAK